MFCPKCATQNLEGASFCRSCGANISLIPQALSGQMPEAIPDESRRGRRARRRGKELSLDHSFKNIFMGIAFLIVAIALSRSIGAGWWFWMLLPAFSMMGTGIAQYIRLKEQEKRNMIVSAPLNRTLPDRRTYPEQSNLPPRNTGELMPPVPSVTEGTTRHLGAEAQTRHLDAEQK
jgi:zinc ribbon protein